MKPCRIIYVLSQYYFNKFNKSQHQRFLRQHGGLSRRVHDDGLETRGLEWYCSLE